MVPMTSYIEIPQDGQNPPLWVVCSDVAVTMFHILPLQRREEVSRSVVSLQGDKKNNRPIK